MVMTHLTLHHRARRWFSLAVACSMLAVPVRTAGQRADADREFRRGLTALHEFEYEEANEAFRRAQQLDPGFALAYWGEAMTYHQSLWRHENLDAARRALARLGPTPAARAGKCRTAKEADLLAAAETLFGRGDSAGRRRDYAGAMRRVHARYADDPDIAALYALSLLGTMSRSLIGAEDSHEGHSQGLAGSDIQAQAAAILNDVLKAHPDHRGALHYLLHDYDDPEHARLALAAARAYAHTGSESSHAQHMPAHIFLQLGMWADAADADRAAVAASDRWVARKHLGAAMRNVHALSWLQYELLQLGRYRDAAQTISALEPVVKTGDNVILLSDLSSMRARYAIETERWDLMANQNNFANVNDLFAIGLSAARSGGGSAAEHVRGVLAERAQAKEEGDMRPAIAIMERELAASIALAAGRRDEAVSILVPAAQAELDLPLPLGLPAPIKPAPELLGEVLLELSRPGEALEWFERALRRQANRSRSVVGLARAAAATGHVDVARQRYSELLTTLAHADDGLPEIVEARAALQTPVAQAGRTLSRGLALSVGAAAAVAAAAGILISRRKKRRPAPVKGAGLQRRAKQTSQKR